MKVAVLASGTGTTFENLVKTQNLYNGKIEVLFVSKLCGACQKADAHGVKWMHTDDSEVIFDFCRLEKIDVVACAGWVKKLVVPADFKNRVMNIHPSLLPAFGGEGMYGMKVHEAVAASGVKYAGCTVHFADDNYDTGPIILQRAFELQFQYPPEKLQARVQQEENIAYPKALNMFRWGLKVVNGIVTQDQWNPDYRITSGTSKT